MLEFFVGNTRCNRSVEMLEHFVEKPQMNILMDGEFTFYAANGTSVIDLSFETNI